MRAIIVDDEPVARRGLRQLLAAHPDVAVVGEARNGREAIRLITTLSPDLVLLDVEMPAGNAFDVLRQLARPLPAVIFITAYDHYAVRAFETHALDYLVKPVHEERFGAAVERARAGLASARLLDRARLLERLLDSGELSLTSVAAPGQRLRVPDAHGELLLDVGDVSWIEAEGYYAIVHASGRRHLLREALDSLERTLDPRHFVRTHRSALVNLAFVRELRRNADDAVLVLDDGTRVPVSRRRRAHVTRAVRQFGRSAL